MYMYILYICIIYIIYIYKLKLYQYIVYILNIFHHEALLNKQCRKTTLNVCHSIKYIIWNKINTILAFSNDYTVYNQKNKFPSIFLYIYINV